MVWSEEVTDFTDGFDELIEGSRADAAQICFQLREGHFDGVEVGALGGQEQEPTSVGLEHLRGGIAFVGGQVVEDHDGPRFQLGDQNLFDIRVEGIPIHGPGYDPGSHDPIAG